METPRKGPSGETIDTSRHRALGSASRAATLRLVRAAAGGATAIEVAACTRQHLSTTRAHLDLLTEAGLLVKARAGGLPGRPAWRYRPSAADPAPAPYRALAAALLHHLSGSGGDIRAAAAQVGNGWGSPELVVLEPFGAPAACVVYLAPATRRATGRQA